MLFGSHENVTACRKHLMCRARVPRSTARMQAKCRQLAMEMHKNHTIVKLVYGYLGRFGSAQ